MQKLYIIILLLAYTILSVAQTHASADKLFQAGDYITAQEQYGKLLRSYPINSLYLYRYARCAQEIGDFSTALLYFDKAGDRYMLKYFYLGEIHLQLWNTEAAITAYNKYLASLQEPNDRVAYIEQQITHAKKLQRYLRRVERLAVIDSVLVSKDQMLMPCVLSPEAGILQYDSIGCIQFTNQRGDQRLWSQYIDSTQVLLSSHRLLDTWTIADTLPATINFTSNQVSPYLLNDGITLYYAALDTNGLGGFDIYVSRYNTATELYTTPENLGFPYNSSANEYMLIVDEVQGIGYLATDRFAPSDSVHIYSFIIPEQKQYCRGLTSDSLVAYAQLRLFDKADYSQKNDSATLNQLSIEPTSHDTIYFILNDSIVYTSVTDFRSEEAKKLFIEWENLQLLLNTEKEQLTILREKYMTANEQTRRELSPLILQLEHNQSHIQFRSKKLLHNLRLIEMSAR